MIPYGRQCIDEDDIKAVVDVLKSDFLTTGPTVKAFEDEFAKRVGAKYAVSVNNGTTALHLAVKALGKDIKEAITTPNTFVASANCVRYVGGDVVFADIDNNTYNISVEDIRNKITKNTDLLIPVHFAGTPCDMDEIQKIKEEYGLYVLEDAAHALGAMYKDKKIGSISDVTTFSFHPVKHITTGEGGMVTTNDPNIYDRLLYLRTHGITRDKNRMTKYDGAFYYEQIDLGFNYRLSDLNAALGLSQLLKIEKFLKRRREIARKYDEVFDRVGIKHQKVSENMESAYHLYVIEVENRNELYEFLKKNDILTQVHYIPVHTQPYYRSLLGNISLEKSENYYSKALSLPIYYSLTDEEQDYVIDKILEFYNKG